MKKNNKPDITYMFVDGSLSFMSCVFFIHTNLNDFVQEPLVLGQIPIKYI